MQNSIRKLIIFGVVAGVSFALDQITKYLVAANFFIGETYPVIERFFHITYVRNIGIVFGAFSENRAIFWLTSFIGLLIVLSVVYYIYLNLNKFSTLKIIAYGLILGGGLGNTWDRFFLGYVIDMIDFRWFWSYIFNMADLFINIAIILLILENFIFNEKR